MRGVLAGIPHGAEGVSPHDAGAVGGAPLESLQRGALRLMSSAQGHTSAECSALRGSDSVPRASLLVRARERGLKWGEGFSTPAIQASALPRLPMDIIS